MTSWDFEPKFDADATLEAVLAAGLSTLETCFQLRTVAQLKRERRNYFIDRVQKEFARGLAKIPKPLKTSAKKWNPAASPEGIRLRTTIEAFHTQTLRDYDEELNTFARKLRELSDNIPIEPVPDYPWTLLETSYSSTFRSQGLGADAYTKGALYPPYDALISHGIDAEIRMKKTPLEPEPMGDGEQITRYRDIIDYELWARCPDWIYRAVAWRITTAAAVRSYNSRTLNARVYMPMLDPNIDIWKRD